MNQFIVLSALIKVLSFGRVIMHVRSQDEIDGSSVSYDTIIRTWINCGVIMA